MLAGVDLLGVLLCRLLVARGRFRLPFVLWCWVLQLLLLPLLPLLLLESTLWILVNSKDADDGDATLVLTVTTNAMANVVLLVVPQQLQLRLVQVVTVSSRHQQNTKTAAAADVARAAPNRDEVRMLVVYTIASASSSDLFAAIFTVRLLSYRTGSYSSPSCLSP